MLLVIVFAALNFQDFAFAVGGFGLVAVAWQILNLRRAVRGLSESVDGLEKRVPPAPLVDDG